LARIESATTATELGSEGSALSGRWGIWVASSHAFLERPLTGAGLDAHRAAVSRDLDDVRTFKGVEKEAHNTYISVLVETGIVGFLIFAIMIGTVINAIRRLTGWRAWYWSAQASSPSGDVARWRTVHLGPSSLCVATSAVAGSRLSSAAEGALVSIDAPTPGRGVTGAARQWQPAPQRPR
jgi:O-antigen ligase